jgi:hypothetical protein
MCDQIYDSHFRASLVQKKPDPPFQINGDSILLNPFWFISTAFEYIT